MKNHSLKTLLFVFLGAFSMTLFAQDQVFQKNDKDLSFGIGFGTPWGIAGYSTVLPPLGVNFDYALRDDWGPGVFGVGGYAGLSSYKYTYFGFNANYTTIMLTARATYHYTFVDNLDTYGGAQLGFRAVSSSGDDFGTFDPGGPNNVVNSLFVGARYYFSDEFAAYSELAWDIAFFTIGITYKF
jgi:hypothetical protein